MNPFKNSRLARISIYASALSTVVLSLLYITQASLRPFVPLWFFLELKAVFPFILVALNLLLVLALFVSNMRAVYKFVLLAILFFMFCASGWLMLDTEYLLDSVQVEDHRYSLVVVHQIGDNHTTCLLYECNSNDLACNEIPSYDGDCWSLERAKLQTNPSASEVSVFIDDEWSDGFRLDFTYDLP